MKGKFDLRYEMPEAAKIKSRVEGKESTEFTKDLKAAINDAVLNVLNTNNLTVRAQVIKNLESAGWRFKKESYRTAVEKNNMDMVTVKFFAKGGEEDQAADSVANESAEGCSDVEGPWVVDDTASEEFDQ